MIFLLGKVKNHNYNEDHNIHSLIFFSNLSIFDSKIKTLIVKKCFTKIRETNDYDNRFIHKYIFTKLQEFFLRIFMCVIFLFLALAGDSSPKGPFL